MSQIALAADFAIIIVVATITGMIVRQLGQPTIIVYIATGVLLGPIVFNLVTDEGLVYLMAELGLGFFAVFAWDENAVFRYSRDT
jgi:Kef-type K+ transport system membrane component KefB